VLLGVVVPVAAMGVVSLAEAVRAVVPAAGMRAIAQRLSRSFVKRALL